MEWLNFVSNIAARPRRDFLYGREHLVAPVTMIVPGVLNGLLGPLLYLESEIAKSALAWNGVPLVLDHPMRDGKYVSARDPEILAAIGLGKVFNAVANGKLSAEAWFDVENTRRIHPGVLARLEAGTQIEVSTGLGADLQRGNVGNYNGREYVAVATNYRPDHLAILPDGVGACSIKDSCGVFNSMCQNNQRPPFDPNDMLPVTVMNWDEPIANEKKPGGFNDKSTSKGLVTHLGADDSPGTPHIDWSKDA